MDALHVELPDKLAEELRRLIETGWFQSEEEAVRIALAEFIQRRQAALIERFQRADIDWALSQAEGADAKHREP